MTVNWVEIGLFCQKGAEKITQKEVGLFELKLVENSARNCNFA